MLWHFDSQIVIVCAYLPNSIRTKVFTLVEGLPSRCIEHNLAVFRHGAAKIRSRRCSTCIQDDLAVHVTSSTRVISPGLLSLSPRRVESPLIPCAFAPDILGATLKLYGGINWSRLGPERSEMMMAKQCDLSPCTLHHRHYLDQVIRGKQ